MATAARLAPRQLALSPATAEADSLAPDLEALLAELGETAAVVQLWRMNERGRSAYLERIPAAEFTLELVRDVHGGGTYQARALGADNKFVKQYSFAIAGAPKAAGTTDAEPSRLDRLEAALGQLAERLTNPPAPAADPLAMALKIVEIMRPAMQQPAPAPAAASDPAAMFTLVDKMMDLRERIAGDMPPAPARSNLGAVVQDGVKPLVGLLQQKMANDEARARARAERLRNAPPAAREVTPARPAAVLPASSTPAADVAAADSPPAPAVSDDPIAQLAERVPKMARKYLANCAAADKDPSLYAELVIDSVPGDVVDQLPALLEPEDAAARLVAAVPEWHDHAEWFGELVDAIRAELAQQLEGAADDGAAAE